MYDHTGVMGFTYQGQTYFYQKDLQGNIFAIVNAAGVAVAFYHYDAWGNHKVYDGDYITEMTSPTFIGNLNPFRYRGYYYDTETKLYYLQSRYYDPEVGRFISADQVEYTTPEAFDGLNIYAYCNNNPVMFVDPTGHSAVVIGILIGVVVGLILGLGYAAHKDRADNGEIDGSVGFKTYAGYGLLFAIMGGIIGAGIGYIWPAIRAFVSSSFTIGGGLSVSGAVGATSGGIVITGGQILAGVSAVALTGNIVFYKGSGPRFGHNQSENRQFNQLRKKYKLTKDEARELHDMITKQNFSFKEIEEIIRSFFRK